MVGSKLIVFTLLLFLAACAQETSENKGLRLEELVKGKADMSVRKGRASTDINRKGSVVSDSLPEGTLLLGIVRWDGIIALFGAFDGKKWERPKRGWLEDRSQVMRWNITSKRGTEWQVEGKGTVTPTSCFMYERWGQQVDFPPDTVHWSEFFDTEEDQDWADITCPVARIGIALNDTLSITLMKASEERERDLLEQIQPVFEKMEADEVQRLNRDTTGASQIWTGHPVSAAERSQSPIELEVEHADAPAEGVRLYRFVASRHYAPTTQRNHSCPTRTSLEGFVVEARDRLKVINSNLGFVGGCADSPGMGGLTVEPLGLLNLKEKSYLLGLEWGWEWSAPVIYEVSSTGLHEVLRDWKEEV